MAGKGGTALTKMVPTPPCTLQLNMKTFSSLFIKLKCSGAPLLQFFYNFLGLPLVENGPAMCELRDESEGIFFK